MSERGMRMRTIITGRHMDISPALHDRVDVKMSKLDKYFGTDTEAHIKMHVEKNRHFMEATIVYDGITFRGEDSESNMFKSIDIVTKRIEKQIRHHRSKLEKRLKHGAFSEEFIEEPLEDEDIFKVVKTKKFPVKPLDVEEATMQIQQISHNFFVFTNADTGQVNVLYKRKDGDLGLIEPEY